MPVAPPTEAPAGERALIEATCAHYRAVVLEEMSAIVARHGRPGASLYAHMLDYPMRPAKALRPTLCVVAARALGTTEESVLTSAAAIELLHNAFLVHDDVEDESLLRRGEATLQRGIGLAGAVNVGDGMLALALRALLDNTRTVGLGPALDTLLALSDTLQRTVEGQDVELAWIAQNACRFEADTFRARYEEMVFLKTAAYSFVAPLRVAAIAAECGADLRAHLDAYGRHLGIAFQIADDLLNLQADAGGYGKELAGDLWEGKRTLILLHALHREADEALLKQAIDALSRPRPTPAALESERRIDRLIRDGAVPASARDALLGALHGRSGAARSAADVDVLSRLIARNGSTAYARGVAEEHVALALAALGRARPALAPGEPQDFLWALPRHVITRLR
jgi:geranylgeranyl diphosphate synthase type II